MPEVIKKKKKLFFVAVIRDIDEDGATLSDLIPIDYDEVGIPEFVHTILEKHPTARTSDDWEWLFKIVLENTSIQTCGKFLNPYAAMNQIQVSGAHLTMVHTIEIGEPCVEFYEATLKARDWQGKVGPEVIDDANQLYRSMGVLRSPALDFARVILAKIVRLGIVSDIAPENCELDFFAKP